MKIDRAEIVNFRSLREVTVTFDPPCRVLVGINESGKSNILRALRLLGDDYDPSRSDDMRDALPREDSVTKSYVRFVFRFDKAETDEVYRQVSAKVLSSAKDPDIVQHGSTTLSLSEFCATRNEGIYSVNILEEEKSFTYWTLKAAYKLQAGWRKPTAACPQDFKVELKGKAYQLSAFSLVRAADVEGVPDGYLEDATTEDLASVAGTAITKVTKENVPDVLFWEYDEDSLLPGSVKIDEFLANPDSCVPLKNMFLLANIKKDDIKTSIETARKGTSNHFQNYLNRIADKTTTHFRSVWKEYRNVEFSLRLNADQILPGVKEENTHDFARRSDGFKRFVTFLLMISVNVKTDNLTNTLLLIDEPDVSLHPSGARYLRDELIHISKKNYVVYSTHSIFMIDSGDIGRHYIVKKEKEVTTIEQARESNVADEEVLYNALGHSVFSILKEKNIIFEGWKDKRLFEVALTTATAAVKRKFKDVGICHAKGAGSIKAITPMIALAQRSCVIVSDSDTRAKQEQTSYKRDKGFGEWNIYQDIDSTITATTGEDFVKNDFIATQVRAVIGASSMPSFPVTVLPADAGKLVAIQQWLTTNGMSQEQAKDTLVQIKDAVFEKLKPQHIEDSYTKLLAGITL